MTKRIVHVDDDPDIRDAVARILRKNGYAVEHYLTMKDFIASLEQNNNAPDLAILDVMVESMDAGLTAYAEIQKNYPYIQTIFLTSLGDMIRPYFDKESDKWVCVMEKPVEPESLLSIIEDRLAQNANG
ncbi:Response regulator receiver domain-containing protein [Nitrosomonas sp. Nm51]|uniref:response regulator n=1 Tax=Nitrosomonas sp. Nm51 TaxID=133720 RepID=UPI0008B82402|nr:response regulator [Nitrosomonas sp. Nm51]SER59132.1 Response regulator receiver domain-containing protein [Nitrosomonas sp. Nm51]